MIWTPELRKKAAHIWAEYEKEEKSLAKLLIANEKVYLIIETSTNPIHQLNNETVITLIKHYLNHFPLALGYYFSILTKENAYNLETAYRINNATPEEKLFALTKTLEAI